MVKDYKIIILVVLVLLFLLPSTHLLGGDTIIDLSFKQADIRDIVSVLGDLTGNKIILHPDAVGRISVHLNAVSFLTSLTMITEILQYVYVQVDDTFFIAPSHQIDDLLVREETRMFSLKYVAVERIQEYMRLHLPHLEPIVHAQWNLLVIKGKPQDLEKVQLIINRLDRQETIKQEFLYYTLQHREGATIVPLLTSLIPNLQVQIHGSSQDLILRGSEEVLKMALELLVDLDRYTPRGREVPIPIPNEMTGEKYIHLLTSIFPSLQLHLDATKENLLIKGDKDQIQEALELISLLRRKLSIQEVLVYSLKEVHQEEVLKVINPLPPKKVEVIGYKGHLILFGSKDQLANTLDIIKKLDDGTTEQEVLTIALGKRDASDIITIIKDLLPGLYYKVDDQRKEILLIGSQDDLKGVKRIMARLDRGELDHETILYPLHYIYHIQLAPLLTSLIPSLTISGERSRSISLQGTPSEIEEALSWIRILDIEAVENREVSLYSLTHDAELLSLLPSLIPSLYVQQVSNHLILMGHDHQLEKAREWLKWMGYKIDEEIIGSLPFKDDLLPEEMPFTVTGIVERGTDHLAIIEGEGKSFIIRVGDYIAAYEVVKIKWDKVIIMDEGGQLYTLLLGGQNGGDF